LIKHAFVGLQLAASVTVTLQLGIALQIEYGGKCTYVYPYLE